MTVPVRTAARRLCEKSNWSLSNLELQKLLYIAHMFHLGQEGEPLVAGDFQAWMYGPVHKELYDQIKAFGADPVRNFFHGEPPLDDTSSEAKFLDATYEKLKNAPSGRLVQITHWKDGAWAKHYKPGMRGTIIPRKDIIQEYKKRTKVA